MTMIASSRRRQSVVVRNDDGRSHKSDRSMDTTSKSRDEESHDVERGGEGESMVGETELMSLHHQQGAATKALDATKQMGL